MSEFALKLAPSMIAADLSRFAEVIAELESVGVEWLHWDIMDGRFVPNISFGPMVVQAARPLTGLHFDVHLMIEQPGNWIDQFADAGADGIDVHVEGCDLNATLPRIKARGLRAGVVLNPGTPVASIRSHLPTVDNVIVMSVQPGFAGQKFMPTVVPKIEELAQLRATFGHNFELIVDGGMSPETAAIAARAGATVLVCGASSVFIKGQPLATSVAAMRRSVA